MINNQPIRAIGFFHKKPQNYNCAQSILKAYQEQDNIDDATIEEFRANGGGRAPQGYCGALYAANYIRQRRNLPNITEQFTACAGHCTCKELKANGKVPCEKCVELADSLLK